MDYYSQYGQNVYLGTNFIKHMRERDGLLAGKEHQTVVSLSMWFGWEKKQKVL